MSTTHRIVALSVLGLLGLAEASVAATITLKGRSTWTPVSETSNKLADGRTVTRQVLRGTALNDNPNTPLSNASQDCMFTTVTSADGKSFSSVATATAWMPTETSTGPTGVRPRRAASGTTSVAPVSSTA